MASSTWILHYSFINHQFYHSTITIKQKIIINKLVTELLWGHFLWKNCCSNKNVKFRSKKTNSADQIPREKPKFRGSRKTVGPSNVRQEYKLYGMSSISQHQKAFWASKKTEQQIPNTSRSQGNCPITRIFWLIHAKFCEHCNSLFDK